MLHIVLTGLAGLCIVLIFFSIRYYRSTAVSLCIAGVLAAVALITLYYYVPLIFAGSDAQLYVFREGDIYYGAWGIGLFYGLLYGQRSGKVPADKEKRFYLETVGGKRIYFGDPRDNFLVYAGANAGKTKSIGKPLLEQYIKHGYAGFIYDYKDYDYSKTAYNLVQKHNYPHKLYQVNFVNPSTSCRFNPIKPAVLRNEVLLIQLMDDMLGAKLRDDKDRNEWYYGALGVLKGVAYRIYTSYPHICTIPHIVNYIVQSDREQMEKFLRKTPESKALAAGFLDSTASEKTRASILFTLTNHLSDLAFNKTVQYILTGDDFDFNLLDPAAPKLVAVANSYAIEGIISPVITLMATMSSRAFNMQNEVDFFYLFDEATTTKIPDFEKMPSVLREYRCSFVLLTQSGAKIEKLYGKLDRSSIESNFGNIFLGRTKDTEALKTYGLLFSKKEEKRKTYTRGHSGHGSSSSTSTSKTKELRYEPHFYTNLKAGEFVGSAAHSNYQEFHLKFLQYDAGQEQDLPIIRMVLPSDIEQNYLDIITTVKNLE